MAAIAPGTVIAARYRVIQPLGEGGMKTVYLAEDVRFKARHCALAVMVDNLASEQARRDAVFSFEREADVLAQLDHPAIPKVSDRFSEQDHHYFVMDYVAGRTLEGERAAAGGRLRPREAIDFALQICGALHYLHNRVPPVVLRDLKPANVMVTPQGSVKLIDFGIARHFTRAGTTVGTIGYAAPEQYQGRCDARSDIYALGATLHHLLTGRDPACFPFDFWPLSTLLPGCDPVLEQLVSDALKRAPAERPASAQEFARRLLAMSENVVRRQERDQRPLSLGMQNCSRCGVEIPADGTRCANCGEPVTIGGRRNMAGNKSLPLSSPADQFCPQCGREIPIGSALCMDCVQSSQTQPNYQSQRQRIWSNRLVILALVTVFTAVAGGLLARALWGSEAEVPWPIWIIAGLILLALEVHYTRDFTLFCFGISALIVGLIGIFGVFEIRSQGASFAALSTILLFWARQWLRKKMLGRPGHEDLENIIGQLAIPLVDLPPYGFGQAELRGTTWSAHNAGHVRIERGQRCKVMKMNGLMLWIMPE